MGREETYQPLGIGKLVLPGKDTGQRSTRKVIFTFQVHFPTFTSFPLTHSISCVANVLSYKHLHCICSCYHFKKCLDAGIDRG